MFNIKRIIISYLLICWLIAIIIILLSPMPIVYPEIQKITFYDKAAHLVLFGVLTFLSVALLDTFKKINTKLAALIGLVFASVMMFLGEYLQMFIPGRSPSIYDFLGGLLGVIIALVLVFLLIYEGKKRLLLHVCCATCAIYVQELLSREYEVVLYYYNPCIYPKDEYKKRLADVKKISRSEGLRLIVGAYRHSDWKKKVKGHEHDPEGGDRCRICYQDRLEQTARKAMQEKIEYFTSTLTVSPHKKAKVINSIGQEAAEKYGREFLEKDFKKADGFKRSVALSKKHKFYRQDHCGCEYSQRKE